MFSKCVTRPITSMPSGLQGPKPVFHHPHMTGPASPPRARRLRFFSM